MGNSRKNLLKYGYVALATFVATKLVGGVCLLFSIMLIASLLITGKVLFEVLDKQQITAKRVIIALAIVFLMMGLGVYHRFNCHKSQTTANPEPAVECEDEKDDCTQVQDIVVPEATVTPSKKSQTRRKATSPKDISDKSTIKDTIGKEEAKTTTGETTNVVTIPDDKSKQEEKITEDAIKKAEEEGDKVNKQEDGIVTITKPQKPENKEEEKTPVIDVDKAKEEAEKIPSNESNKDQKPAEDLEVKKDEFVAADDNELNKLLEATSPTEAQKPAKEEKNTTPVAETKTEEVKVESKPVVETVTEEVEIPSEPVVETVEPVEETEIKDVETAEPVVEVIEAQEVKDAEIKVTAIDGYEGFVGSDIQFKVTGDNVVVDGLDGTNSSFNSETGILTINATEATVVSVELTNATSNVSFDVTINGIVR